MDIALGTHVRAGDEQDLGVVDRLILDPTSGRVRAAVIRKGFVLPHDVEIPLDALSSGPDGEVRVPYTADQIHTLPRFQPGNYTSPPPAFVPPQGYPGTAFYWPIGSYGLAAPPAIPEPPITAGGTALDSAVSGEARAALRRQDLENAVIDQGSTVLSRDEQKVGEVHQLAFDPSSGLLTHIVVRKGFLFARETELPASLIAEVDDGVVYLAVDAADQRLGSV